MNSKNSVLPLVAIGAILIGLTLAVFFLLEIERTEIALWALGALLLAEVVLIGGLIALRTSTSPANGIFLKAGVTSSLIIYFAATFITVLISGIFANMINVFVLLQLGIIAFFLIAVVLVATFAKSIANRSVIDAQKVNNHEPKRGGF